MPNNVRSRLTVLERAVPDGCPACRDWSPRFQDVHGVNEPSTVFPRERTCPRCGWTVATLLVREYVIVGDDDMDGAA